MIQTGESVLDPQLIHQVQDFACTEMSSLAVGSSAMISFGFNAGARATPTRLPARQLVRIAREKLRGRLRHVAQPDRLVVDAAALRAMNLERLGDQRLKYLAPILAPVLAIVLKST